MSKLLRLAPWIAAVCAALPVTPVAAQGNIDAGKTPAQIFGDTCSACHRSARELKRASMGFLRTHYSTGADEAAAMAGYLASVANDPRAGQPKRPPTEVGKQAPRPSSAEPKSAQGAAVQPKGRPPNLAAQTRPAPVMEERPPDPPPAPPPPAPVAPVLEPFEE